MDGSVVGGFKQVDLKSDNAVDEIHQGDQTRTEIIQNVEKQGAFTREAIRHTSGKLLSVLHRYIDNAVNVMHQKSVSVMPPTLDLIRTQGAWNA